MQDVFKFIIGRSDGKMYLKNNPCALLKKNKLITCGV
jgi:hypothetical protein